MVLLLWVFGAFVASEGVGNYPLELAVDRAEFLLGPGLHFFHSGSVEPEQEAFCGFFFRHDCLVVERAGVHYGLSRFVGAQYHEQVANHRCFALLVEVYNALLLKFCQSHFYH